jgi:phosphatidylethanolamine-binding protein (PEBP) family uncharacterized protein
MHPVEALLVPLGKAFRNRKADESKSVSLAPQLATSTHFTLTSPSFKDGAEIPAKFCGRFIGDDISPALTWAALPAGTTDVVLVMEDLNSPGSVPRLHVAAEFAPAEDGLPEGALNSDTPGISFIADERGRTHYRGPRPLPGHGPHVYRFHLYALDAHVELTDLEHLPAALDGHVLASGTLTGTRTS